MPTKYIDVKGYATYIHYHGATTLPEVIPDFSRGRKIVLIHGAGGNGHRWQRQVDGLAASNSPVAFDLPGHGRSAGVEGLATVQDYADFVVALMDALKMSSAVIAGWSMGGAIAMDLALRYPARAEALVLVATAAKFNLAQDRIDALRAVTMGRAPQSFVTDGYAQKTVKEKFDLVREGWMEQIKTDPRVRYTDILACSKVDLRESVSKIDKPTVIFAGAEDQLIPAAEAELIKSRIRGAQLNVVADAGHMIPVEQAADFNAAIEQFVAGLK